MKKLVFITFIVFLLVSCVGKQRLLPPNSIRIENDTIMFDTVQGAKYYELEIDGQIIQLNENKYTLEEFGVYKIRIRSIGQNDDKSVFSAYINIVYDDSTTPYIVDGDNKTYIYENDLNILFYLPYNYYIKSITAPNNDINNDEYSIDGNEVILKDRFLKRKFEEDRQNLILAFVVSNDDKQYIVNVFITK